AAPILLLEPIFPLFSLPRSPLSTLFPYTTLFRSRCDRQHSWGRQGRPEDRGQVAQPVRLARGSDRACGRDHRERRREPEKGARRSEEHTSELQSRSELVCRLLLEKKKT